MFLWGELPEGRRFGPGAAGLERTIVMAPGNIFSVSQTAGRFLRFNVAQSADKENLRCAGNRAGIAWIEAVTPRG